MRSRFERGDSQLEDILALSGLLIIIFFFVLPGEVPDLNYAARSSSNNSSEYQSNSDYSPRVSLGRGNASYAYQPNSEYVTITNSSNAPLNITGWKLANGKDTRDYGQGGTPLYYERDEAFIPLGSPFISPTGSNILQNVVLEPGESAIVTTGSVGSRSPYNVTSFKENICSGYLGDMPEYNFTPSLSRSCPSPTSEPGFDSLPGDCKNFIKRLSSCEVPEFDGRDSLGDSCSTCVNGTRLSSTCSAFIKNHYNYGSCIALHAGDPNFYGRTWRVFLGRGWEMWGEDYETILLYDQLGNLVDSVSY